MLKLNQPFTLRWRTHSVTFKPELQQSLLLAVLLAFFWWGIAYYLRATDAPILIWDDQQVTFVRGFHWITRPYEIPGFVNPPWALVILFPFNIFSLPFAVLAQLIVYFVLMTLVIFKFEGDRWSVLLTFTCAIALDSGLELNIDWIVLIGLLVPQMYSAPFLMVKPQVAPGYVLSFTRQQFIRASIVGLAVLLISFLLWGFWIPDYIASAQLYQVSWLINLAPMALFGLPISLVMGVALALYAFRKRDPLLSILAGYFFVPYIAGYSLLLPFALIACRWRWVAFGISVAVWLQLAIILLG